MKVPIAQLFGRNKEGGTETRQYLSKWIVIGTIVGVGAGLGAVAFSKAIELASWVFLESMAGYVPPMPLGEGEPVRNAIAHPWLLPLVCGLGGLLSGILVFRFAPEAEGHGTDAAIDAIHHRNGHVNPMVLPVKLVASAITIGSGGSAGREGPAAQISTGFASILARLLRLSPRDARLAVAAGMGAGIGAIFRAPLGGALMAVEILYLHDLEAGLLIPAMIASVVAFSVYGLFEGWDPIFGVQANVSFDDPLTLVYFAALGVIAGLVGLLYVRAFYGTTKAFHRLNLPNWSKPAIGGVLVGLMGLVVHGSVHTGYGWVQIGMSPELMTLPLWLVIALPFAKILATSLSIGSGGSGGVFGPGMVIGGMLGATFWRLFHHILPHMGNNPAPYVIVGMVAMFGSVAHAPFAMMLMVGEMTGNLSMLAPAMLAIAIATIITGDESIYRSQLADRTASAIHRMRMSFPLLSAITAGNAAKPAGAGPLPSLVVSARDGLDDVLLRMAEEGVTSAQVHDDSRVAGVLTYKDALLAYHTMVKRGLRNVERMPKHSTVMDFRVMRGAKVDGVALRDAGFPTGTLVAAITRGGEEVFPSAKVVLQPDDVLTVVAKLEMAQELDTLVRAGSSDA